ncbi:hypothetical protein BC936DRAFT_142580 [Jimgerdemannia flammicorona]|uniref:Uncharacterized protein n=2 Tax=Jimgerdemannia flammicorona TaxID=994334 RepID=A0A433Q719_9FUNG|nr:hypothetical protein BC936DRAFT_142580 [Jimgerdemannia flammicorona]RUS25572.1 hypothetical protein BC938DRAFT_471949 [Jimgerdemannia flammicorona]
MRSKNNGVQARRQMIVSWGRVQDGFRVLFCTECDMKESAVNLSDHPEHYSRLHWQQLCHPTLLSFEQFLTSFISSPAVPSPPQISILTTWDTAPHLYQSRPNEPYHAPLSPVAHCFLSLAAVIPL